MKVYIVTHGFKNPRYTTTNGVYRGVFDTIEKAREYIELSVDADTKYFGSTITGEFTREDGAIFIEGVNRFEDQYFNYAIHKEEV